MRKVLSAVSVLAVIAVITTYFMLTTTLQPEQRPVGKRSDVITIEMSTRQWRFDVLSVSPSGSAEFSLNPPTGQFAETTIAVRKGDTLILRIKNFDVPHGFALEEFGINSITPPGETTEVKFVASQTGKFTFFCTVFCGTGHPNHKGTLIVES